MLPSKIANTNALIFTHSDFYFLIISLAALPSNLLEVSFMCVLHFMSSYLCFAHIFLYFVLFDITHGSFCLYQLNQ